MPILLGVAHIIQPTVMSMVNIFITGIASLFVALEPDKTRVKGNFYKNVTKTGLLAGFYMFIPVLAIMLYAIFSQIARTGKYDLSLMKTIFDNGEIISFGWVPVMAICVTISGFIIFFENCRPFTRFRKILFTAVLVAALVVLYLLPEYFIVSGTDMLEYGARSRFFNIFKYQINHIGPNAQFALYRTMTLEQVLFIVGYALIAYPLYLANKKFAGIAVDKLLFSPREFKDE